MKLRGKVKAIAGTAVMLEADVVPAGLNPIIDRDCDIEIKPHREHRSLDSNAYFHVLCDKLRQAVGITKAEAKTEMICAYGQIEYVDGVPAIIDSNIPPETMRKNEFLHLSCVRADVNGTYSYVVYRGSHTYDSAEMNRLIEGTVSECKELGIETATPDELAKMAQAWERKYGQEKEG